MSNYKKLIITCFILNMGSSMSAKKLETYKNKRNFKKTPEPSGKEKSKKLDHPIFVVQKHNASHLHYDFRIEMNGVLKSWAIPKGPSNDPNEKRLAVETEDHPMSYATFEGTIPEGNYGAGTVKVWDHGTFESIKPEKLEQSYKNGKIEIKLNGKKLKGNYVLVRTKLGGNKKNWLFKKMLEREDNDPKIKIGKYEVSITNPDKILFPKDKITKGEVVNYYNKIGKIMLPHVKDRLVTMLRYPQGISQEGFYHKDAPDFFPKWIETKTIKREDGKPVNYVIIENIATLVYLANFGCLTPHIWLSKEDKIDYPDRLIFDLDPSNDKSFGKIKTVAKELKKLLEAHGLVPFVMTTGSRGMHVVVPLKRTKNFEQVRTFAQKIAKKLVDKDPKNLTMEIRKDKRGTKIFIDTLRNSFGATGVAPYAIRAKNGAPIAAPLNWQELDGLKLTSQTYNIFNIFERLKKIGDPWKNINKHAKNIKNI